ncbi:MAG TPA: PDZ domain-containing protein, partial [Longimicrobiaceae bacterium]|nr:PDZ domain-containing protein [Longimicrobiaceae bacterium]
GYGASDHSSFYARDIPVLHFFTNVHDDYHRPSDVWEKIDYEGLNRVTSLLARLTRAVADRPAALTLQRGAGAPPRTAEGRGYGAFLGTVPDFSPADRGVRISGVRGGSPAEQAGLKEGDVIVGMDEQEIADLYAFTDALRARKPGDGVCITVLREGQQLTLPAVLGSRSAP